MTCNKANPDKKGTLCTYHRKQAARKGLEVQEKKTWAIESQ